MAQTPWRRQDLKLEVKSGVEHTEASTVPGGAPGAGKGAYWVRDDATTVPMFTDSAGADHVLNAAGGSGALTGLPGNIYEDLKFYVDPADRNSFPAEGGTVATDLEGNGTAGTLSAAAIFDNGAWTFDGASGNVSFTKGATLDNIFAGGGTVIALIRPYSDGGGTFGRILDTTESGSFGYSFFVREEQTGYINLGFDRVFTGNNGNWSTDDVTNAFGETTRLLQMGSWATVAVSYTDGTGNDPTFYLNGTSVAFTEDGPAPTGTAVTDAGNDVYIGNRSDAGFTFDGQLGTVLMFDRILTADEIRQVSDTFAARRGIGIRGYDSPTGSLPISGSGINLRAGDALEAAASSFGGNIVLQAGDQTHASGGPAGEVVIRSGHQTTGTSYGTGSRVLVESGRSSTQSGVTVRVGLQDTSGAPGTLTLSGADNDTGAGGPVLLRGGGPTSGIAGAITVRGGDAADNGGTNNDGGAATFRGGDGNGFGGDGGALTLRAGDGVSDLGGSVLIRSGTSVGFDAGDVTITASDAGSFGLGGNIIVTAGLTTTTSVGGGGGISFTTGNSPGNFLDFHAGDFTITTGNATGSPSAVNSGAGSFIFTGGTSNGTSTTSPGGEFEVTAGAGTANSVNSRGGAVSLTGGAVTGTAAATAGGVTLTGGAATVGTGGAISLQPGAGTVADGALILDYSTWPATDGTSGFVLSTDGAGALSWISAGGGASAWSAVLAVGATSGGTDPVISSGDTITGVDASSGDAFVLALRGGNTTDTALNADGGNLTITGGSTASTAATGTAVGGDVLVVGGGATAGTGLASGGSVTLQGATPATFNGTGGSVSLLAGDGGTGGGNAFGGDITITAGDAKVSAAGGFINLTGGMSEGASLAGGPINLTGGQSNGSSGIGGLVNITGGQGESTGGTVTIKGGTKNAAGATFQSGSILIEAGDIAGTSGYDFGDITIQVPSPATPSADNVAAGNVIIAAGDNGIRNADGGNVSITAGDTFGFDTRLGGSISLSCGDENNGSSSSEGGSVIMAPGTSVSGTDGRVKIQGTATLEFTERASAIGISAGVGYFWVRSDTPNVPMFTDDAGTDFVLNASGAASAWSAVLAVGATSGGTDPILSNGDVFQGADAAAANAGVMAIRGGDVTSGAGDGGTVNIDGGDAGAGAGSGGPINITGGNSVGSETAGGEIIITGGGATDGGGGGVTAQGGPGTGTARSGGNLILRGGTPGTNASGGQVQISGRPGNGTGSGGLVSIAAGQGGVTGAGANVTMVGGGGGATSGNGGAIVIDGGGVTSGTEGAISIGSVNAGPMLIGVNGGGTRIADTLALGAVGSISMTGDNSITLTPGTTLVLDYATWPTADGTSGQVLSTNGAGTLSWAASGGGSAWSQETTQTTDATTGVTIATPIATVTDGTQHSVEVLITAESGGANTYFRRQVFTFYRDGGGAVQWTTEINGTEARRGLTTATASLSVSSNAVLVTATGEAATTINWKVQYRTTNTITNGGTVSTTGIVRETFDNRGAATTTGTATGSGGTTDFTIAAGASYVNMQFLRVKNASGTCADATIQFFRDAARTDEIYDAQNKDTSTANGWVDRNTATMMGDDGSGLASNIMYGRITNNDAGNATYDVEAVLWGVI